MIDLSRRETKFAFLISTSHFTQHIYYRLLPPLIPVLAVALEYPLWQLGLLITSYSLSMGLVQAPLGVLSDRIDRRYLLPTGLAVTGLAYVIFAFAPVLGAPIPALVLLGYTFEGGFLIMVVAMMIVGVGLSVVHPVGYPMISDNVTDSNKGSVLGAFGASSKLGDAAAPAIIAVLILTLAWDQIILLFGAAGILYGVVLYAVLRSDEYVTVPPGQRSESDAETESSDRKRQNFLYPMVVVYLYFIFTQGAIRSINTFFPAFLVAIYAYSFSVGDVAFGTESVANIYFAVMLIVGAGVQLYLGTLTDRYDPRYILLGCMTTATVGIAALSVFDSQPLVLLAIVAVLGAGLFGVNPARDTLVSDLSPPEYEGRAFGYIFTAATLTTALLPAIVGYFLEVVGMRTGFLLLAAGPVIAGLCITLLFSDRVYLKADTSKSVSPTD